MTTEKKAGFFIRYLAHIIDIFVLLIPALLFLLLVDLSSKGLRDLIVVSIWFFIVFILLSNFIVIFYYTYFTAKFGGSIGKLLFGLRVVNQNGKNLSFSKSLFRHTIGYWLSGMLFGLGFFAIIKNKNKQGWHDQMTGSYVIKKDRIFAGILGFILIFIFAYSLMFINVWRMTKNTVIEKDINDIKKLKINITPTPNEINNLNSESDINIDINNLNNFDFNFTDNPTLEQ